MSATTSHSKMLEIRPDRGRSRRSSRASRPSCGRRAGRRFDAAAGPAEDDPPPRRLRSRSCLPQRSSARLPREWIVRDWLPCGVVTGLYGDGGLGKSCSLNSFKRRWR